MEKNQSFNKDERCDDEQEVFNARVKENEMIITVEEYKIMKARIECLKKEREEFYLKFRSTDEERQQLGLKLDIAQNENTKLTRGILNFIKCLGG